MAAPSHRGADSSVCRGHASEKLRKQCSYLFVTYSFLPYDETSENSIASHQGYDFPPATVSKGDIPQEWIWRDGSFLHM